MDRTEALESYILHHIDAENDYLHRLYRATNIKLVRAHMTSGHLQGKWLRMLVAITHRRNILEVGTFTGYSALCMASALPDDGKLLTFEINDEIEDFTRPWIEDSPWADKIDFKIGDVLTDLPDTSTFDLIYIDGNKRQYIEYYELSLNHLEPDGFILADNTLWDGHVIDPEYDKDAQTLGIRRFNDYIAADKRVEKVILPIRDGLTVIRPRKQ